MLSRTPIKKTRKLFHNLTSLLLKAYKNLHKHKNPLSCSTRKHKNQTYSEFLSQCDSNSVQEDQTRNENENENAILEPKKHQKHQKKRNVIKGGSPYALAQKMKALDMMDAGDEEQMSDVEEALRYYSQIKSPTYVDIVDNFFIDMYSEFSGPQPSSSVNTSKRRLGSRRY